MRVALDSSAARFDRGGTARYIRALLDRRDAIAGVEVVEIDIGRHWPWTLALPRQALIAAHDLLWVPQAMATAARRAGADILHGPAFRVPRHAPLPTVVTIHDDTPWDDPPTASWWTRTSLRRSLTAAAPSIGLGLVTSAAVGEDVRRALPGLGARLRVTPLGVDHTVFRPQPLEAVGARLDRLRVEGRYVLMVGPYGPRKNYPVMASALVRAAAGAGLTLVITGRAAPASPDAGLPTRRLGHVSDDDLAALYAGAEFLFYASTREGFGFPVLEAMACGCPVLTSRGTSLQELAGGAALLADPTDVGSLTENARRLLEDAALRAELAAAGPPRAAGFTWDVTLSTTAAAWRELAPRT